MNSIAKTGSASTRIHNPAQAILHDRGTQILLFLLLHLLLGFVLLYFPQLVNLHVGITLLGALGVATLRAPLSHVVVATAYIVGSEVLWRTANASIFWEAGKYAIILVMLVALFRTHSTRIPVAPFFYFTFMLPSIFITLGTMSLSQAREQISFNLSGPLALFVSAWFFSHITLKRDELQMLLIFCVAPLTAITSLVFFNLLRLNNITWVAASNFSASGEFGPNQVSAALGLGILLIVILLLIVSRRSLLTVGLQLLGLWMLVHTILTFSRGGIVTFMIAVCFLVLHQIAGKKQRGAILIAGVLLLVSLEVILPLLNNYTFGALLQRYTDASLTGRDILMQEDLQYFMESPFTGVGPGGGEARRAISAHTEYSRMLAEHGFLGVISLGLLLYMPVNNYFSGKKLITRGIRGSVMVWSLVTMAHLAMRLAAVSYFLGFGFATIDLSDEDADASIIDETLEA